VTKTILGWNNAPATRVAMGNQVPFAVQDLDLPLRPVPGFFEDGLACHPDAERGTVGLLRGIRQRENVAFLPAALRGLCGGGDLRVAQAGLA
jgi:hypothetical protein